MLDVKTGRGRKTEDIFPGGTELFLFLSTSRSSLRATQSSFRCVQLAMSSGSERLEREADRSSYSSGEDEKVQFRITTFFTMYCFFTEVA